MLTRQLPAQGVHNTIAPDATIRDIGLEDSGGTTHSSDPSGFDASQRSTEPESDNRTNVLSNVGKRREKISMCDPHLPPDAMEVRRERRESRLAVLPKPNGVRYFMLITQPHVMTGYLIHFVVGR